MILILMGVMGSGKSTIGKLLASKLKCGFYDGDDLHPAENIEKMRKGIALDDRDRMIWLEKLRDKIKDCLQRGEKAVVACSALKRTYRNMLGANQKDVKLIYLKGDYNLLRERVENRQHPYMNKDLLKSQLDILEEPEEAVCIDISLTSEVIVSNIIKSLL